MKGKILIGISDTSKNTGAVLTNDLRSKIIDIGRNCEPKINVSVEQVDNVIVIDVQEGDEKPYSCSSGYFRRADGASQKMTQHELRIMYQKFSPISYESK